MGKFGKILLGSATVMGGVLAAPILLPMAGASMLTAAATGAAIGAATGAAAAAGMATNKAIKDSKDDKQEEGEHTVLNSDESKINFLKGIIRLAKCDGKVDPKELVYYEQTAHTIGLSQAYIYVIDTLWESDDIITVEFETEIQKKFFFEYAIQLCIVDGEYSDAEKKEISVLAEELNVDSDIIEEITKRVSEWRQNSHDSTSLGEKDVVAKQVETFKQEYQKIVEKYKDECKENENRKEIMDECNSLILPFVLKLEETDHSSYDVNSYMTAMFAVLNARFSESEESDIPSDIDDIDIQMDYTDDSDTSLFRTLLSVDFTLASIEVHRVWTNRIIELAKNVDWDNYDARGFDEAMVSFYNDSDNDINIDLNIGCLKSDARKLEKLMGTEYPEFDELLDRI